MSGLIFKKIKLFNILIYRYCFQKSSLPNRIPYIRVLFCVCTPEYTTALAILDLLEVFSQASSGLHEWKSIGS